MRSGDAAATKQQLRCTEHDLRQAKRCLGTTLLGRRRRGGAGSLVPPRLFTANRALRRDHIRVAPSEPTSKAARSGGFTSKNSTTAEACSTRATAGGVNDRATVIGASTTAGGVAGEAMMSDCNSVTLQAFGGEMHEEFTAATSHDMQYLRKSVFHVKLSKY
jgi:hypothetical protein